MAAARRRQQAALRGPVRARVRPERSTRHGRTGSTSRRTFQRSNLEQVRQHAITPEKKLVASPLGSVSRAHFDEATGTLYAAVRYPGTRRAHRRDRHEHGRHPRARRPQGRGAVLGDVVRVRPGDAHDLLHDRQPVVARRVVARCRDGRTATAAARRADRRTRLQRRRPLADGRASPVRSRHAGADSAPVHASGTRCTRFRTASCRPISIFRATASGCRRRSARRAATSSCACGRSRTCSRAT